jgi:dihydrofolate reductase
MGKIVISQNITLDGVVEDPTGEEGSAYGGWFDRYMAEDRAAWAEAEYAEAIAADALLMGRRTDAYFGARWNAAPGDWAERLRTLPKYVVSSTLTDPIWVNSTVLRGDVVEEASRLRQRIAGDIVVYASRQLVQTLLRNGLVDEIRLMVFPLVIGTGKRLFDDVGTGAATGTELRLQGAKPVGRNLSALSYEVVRDAPDDMR